MTSDQIQELSVYAPPEAEGERIDRFLAANLAADPPLSRTRVKALILEGALREDGGGAGDTIITDPSQTVRGEATYVITLPPARDPTPQGQAIPLNILHEDNDLIIIDKPAGMVVHPAPGQPDGTLVNALIAHCGPSLTGIGGVMRPGIVHRLDKDTSGVMMAAKTDRAHQRLTDMFAAHDLDRRYQALVWGTFADRGGRIEAPLGRSSRDRKKQAVVANGRFAATNWSVLRALPPFASLVECVLETGRTHQIRVHMAHLGHGVVGDPMYGRALRSGQMPDAVSRDCLGVMRQFERQALHAATLGFDHPVTGEVMEFHSPLPTDMAGLIKTVETAIHTRSSGGGGR